MIAAACTTTVQPTESSTGSGKSDASKPNEDTSSAAAKRVFITSTEYAGSLAVEGRADTGVAGADALCQLAADAAELGGTFKAFLGDATRRAGDNLADVGPWYTVPNRVGFTQKVFNNKANLATSPLVTHITDELGEVTLDATVPTGDVIWVGDSTDHCDGWHTSSSDFSGAVGFFGGEGSRWRGDGTASSCSESYHLLCFEQ